MFENMTCEAARIEHDQAIALAEQHGTAVALRAGAWSRLVALVRRSELKLSTPRPAGLPAPMIAPPLRTDRSLIQTLPSQVEGTARPSVA